MSSSYTSVDNLFSAGPDPGTIITPNTIFDVSNILYQPESNLYSYQAYFNHLGSSHTDISFSLFSQPIGYTMSEIINISANATTSGVVNASTYISSNSDTLYARFYDGTDFLTEVGPFILNFSGTSTIDSTQNSVTGQYLCPPTYASLRIDASNVGGLNWNVDISFGMCYAPPTDFSFQLYDVSGYTDIGSSDNYLIANTRVNDFVCKSYISESFPSGVVYGRFEGNFNGNDISFNTPNYILVSPKNITTGQTLNVNEYFSTTTLKGASNTITVANRDGLIASILNTNSNLKEINAVVTGEAINLFPFTTDELEKIPNLLNVTSIKLFVADASADVGNRTTNINLSDILPNQAVFVQFLNGGDFITINNDLSITLNGSGSKLPYGSNFYLVENADTGNGPAQPDGALVTFKGFNFVLGDLPGGGGGGANGNACFQKGTRILTPTGYTPVEELEMGDLITSTKDIKASISIKSMVKFIGKKEEGALFCLPKDSLKKGKPINDLYMSGDHAYKHNGVWKHMKCASATEYPNSRTKKYTLMTEEDNIEYYHIVIEDYFAHTIVAEGVEVETCFKDNNDGVIMLWTCDEKSCVPLKCEKVVKKNEMKKIEAPKPSIFSMKDIMKKKTQEVKINQSPSIINLIKGGGEREKKKKSMTIWAYNKELNKNMPLNCNEISLPQ